jgi:diaminopimelate epimerase
MRLHFTKMQGAGNDFVVLDATHAPIELSSEQLHRLGDRRFGVGADQILLIEPSARAGVDFRYRIFNNTGDEVEHCGNGARCFVRFARDKGLTARDTIRVETMNRVLELRLQPDGRVTVDMGAPLFEHRHLPFDSGELVARRMADFELWPLDLGQERAVEVAVLSMGNPHAVRTSSTPRFARKVNAGFMQVVSRSQIALRVYERDVGETLACGTGACAAVVAGIRLGWLDAKVDVQTRGGALSVEWAGGNAGVLMTGPAETVFEGEIEL